jgi:flagellar hook-length control protein FliK
VRAEFAPVLRHLMAGLTGDAPARAGSAGPGQHSEALPQDGKLLPLLQQYLDQSASNGMTPEQAMERLSARVAQLSAGDAGADGVRTTLAALRQLLDELPAGPVHAAPFDPAVPQPAAAAEATAGANPSAGAPVSSNPASDQSPPLREAATTAGRGGVPNPGADTPTEPLRDERGFAALSREIRAQVAEARPPAPGGSAGSQPLMAAAGEQGNQPLAASAVTVLKRLFGDRASATGAAGTPRAEPPSIGPPTPALQPFSTPGGASAPVAVSIDTPLNQASWDQTFAERIQWLVSHKLQGAQIKLNPAHLGPMEVRIQVQNDQASIHFTSAHAVVRDTLEAALPRLRDMLDGSGVELVDVDVSGESSAEQRSAPGEQGPGERHPAVADADSPPEPLLESTLADAVASGRLDLFA